MRTSRFIGLLPAAAMLVGCAQTWQRVDPAEPAVFIETSGISRYKQHSRTWVKVDDGAKEIRSFVEFDCFKGAYRTLEATTLVGGAAQASRFDQQYVESSVDSTPGFASAYRIACGVAEDAWLKFNQNPERSR